jgi:hypothetical protein
MRRDANYNSACSQIGERLKEANALLGRATRYMLEERPSEAEDVLNECKMIVEGAALTARWAARLPVPRERE